jgi:16S rRNA (cytosine967-C5)-methyltransferase
VEEGSLLDETIDRYFSSPAAPEQYKPLIHEITSGVVRWRLYLDWILSHFTKETMKKDVRYLLLTSLYQIFFMKKARYHVVNEAVEYAKKDKGQGVANFVNAVLRRAIDEKDRLKLPSDPVSRLSIEYSFPRWLVQRWYSRFGDQGVRELLAAFNKAPVFAIRIDLRQITRDDVIRRLHKKGVAVKKGFLKSALYVDKIKAVLDDDLFAKHVLHIQDETSQMAALFLAPAGGELILDACAGQGTKTDQIAEVFPGVKVVAMDLDRRRLKSVRLTRCVVQADVLKNPFKRERFDSILLDAPCSSLGIIRKHPEIKWRRGEKDMTTLGSLQLQMIKSLSSNLKRGGFLVYSVCSFEPEETTDVVEQAKRDEGFIEDKKSFLSLPQQSGMDGFFIARLKKL